MKSTATLQLKISTTEYFYNIGGDRALHMGQENKFNAIQTYFLHRIT